MEDGKGAQLVALLVPVERAVEMANRGRLQVHNQAAQVVAMKRSLIRVVILQILPAHLVPPHAASPAIRLFLLVKRVLRRSCWRSGVV